MILCTALRRASVLAPTRQRRAQGACPPGAPDRISSSSVVNLFRRSITVRPPSPTPSRQSWIGETSTLVSQAISDQNLCCSTACSSHSALRSMSPSCCRHSITFVAGYVNHPDSSLSLAFPSWITSGLPVIRPQSKKWSSTSPRMWKLVITAASIM